ncbi:MAG: hypothetical protein KatS3mg105_1564 [Gemmatales bacterium]|nr:MAG: hypothetical protein KatS3mg105_1564 [Gemmatales bacterium]
MASSEGRNPFYLLLLLAGLVFVITALAYAIVPVLEERAVRAGEIPPPSPFRDALREDGWLWLLLEVLAIFVFGFLSMGLDRWRSLKKGEEAETISSNPTNAHQD